MSDEKEELARLREAHDWQYKLAGDRLRRIEKDEALLRQALDALHALRVVCGYCKDDEAEVRAGHVIKALRERLGVEP